MLPNEYQLHEYRKDLLRQAEQQRLARSVEQREPLARRAGQTLLLIGARLVAQPDEDGCYTIAAAKHEITVCAA